MAFDVAARVVENTTLGGGYCLTWFDAPEIAASASPGQFVMAGSTDLSELLLRRPFSVCLVGPGGGATPCTIGLLYRVVGRGTALLAHLAAGERAQILGPLGVGFRLPAPGAVPIIAAGGVGIAAFPFWIERLVARGPSPVLVYGGRTRDDLPLLAWLTERARRVVVTTDDGSAGERGLVTQPLDRLLAEGTSRGEAAHVYACGPHAMMKATAEVAASRGATCDVALETPMACGYGVCVGCVVEVNSFEGEYGRYRRVCVDGPVFDAREIRW